MKQGADMTVTLSQSSIARILNGSQLPKAHMTHQITVISHSDNVTHADAGVLNRLEIVLAVIKYGFEHFSRVIYDKMVGNFHFPNLAPVTEGEHFYLKLHGFYSVRGVQVIPTPP